MQSTSTGVMLPHCVCNDTLTDVFISLVTTESGSISNCQLIPTLGNQGEPDDEFGNNSGVLREYRLHPESPSLKADRTFGCHRIAFGHS